MTVTSMFTRQLLAYLAAQSGRGYALIDELAERERMWGMT
jgi:hypothetical protein